MLYCKFPGECDSERILKIGQYLTKLCVDNVGLLFFGPPYVGPIMLSRVKTRRLRVWSVEAPFLFHRLWTKVHQINCACAEKIAARNAVSTTMPCFVPEKYYDQVANLSEILP